MPAQEINGTQRNSIKTQWKIKAPSSHFFYALLPNLDILLLFILLLMLLLPPPRGGGGAAGRGHRGGGGGDAAGGAGGGGGGPAQGGAILVHTLTPAHPPPCPLHPPAPFTVGGIG